MVTLLYRTLEFMLRYDTVTWRTRMIAADRRQTDDMSDLKGRPKNKKHREKIGVNFSQGRSNRKVKG